MLDNNKIEEIEHKIYSSKNAYDEYDLLLQRVINLCVSINIHEELEEYEACVDLQDKLKAAVLYGSNNLSNLTNVPIEDITMLIEHTVQGLIKTIRLNK
jgi:hypothetical protein